MHLICDEGQMLVASFRIHSKTVNASGGDTTLCPHFDQSLAVLFISIPTSQGMPTNIIESSQELSDKDFFCLIIILLQYLAIYNYNLVTSTWVCSIRILSSVGGYYPAPLALLLVFAARRILLPSGQLWFVPSRFQPCLTNLPTVKRPFHVGWFCSRVSVLNNICYRQGVIWFHVNVL